MRFLQDTRNSLLEILRISHTSFHGQSTLVVHRYLLIEPGIQVCLILSLTTDIYSSPYSSSSCYCWSDLVSQAAALHLFPYIPVLRVTTSSSMPFCLHLFQQHLLFCIVNTFHQHIYSCLTDVNERSRKKNQENNYSDTYICICYRGFTFGVFPVLNRCGVVAHVHYTD